MRQVFLTAATLCGFAGSAMAQERFPSLAPEQMTPEQKRVAEAIQSGPRAGVSGSGARTLGGPFNVWLRSPELGDRLQKVGEQLRFRSSIPPALNEFAILITAREWSSQYDLNEFAILITAREWSSQYEWYAHHRLAMQAGLPAAVAAELAQGKRPEGMTDEQRIVYEFCTELHRNRFVSDANFNAAKERFGEQGVMDLIAVSGYYVLVSMTLNTAQVGLPAGVEPPLPEIKR